MLLKFRCTFKDQKESNYQLPQEPLLLHRPSYKVPSFLVDSKISQWSDVTSETAGPG